MTVMQKRPEACCTLNISGAALAFLIAGPITTLPAMAAVWGLVSRRVFALYVLFALIGALVLGYAYTVVAMF